MIALSVVRPAALLENNLDCFMISLSILVVGNLLCFYQMVPVHAKWDLSCEPLWWYTNFGYFSWLWALIVFGFLKNGLCLHFLFTLKWKGENMNSMSVNILLHY